MIISCPDSYIGDGEGSSRGTSASSTINKQTPPEDRLHFTGFPKIIDEAMSDDGASLTNRKYTDRSMKDSVNLEDKKEQKTGGEQIYIHIYGERTKSK